MQKLQETYDEPVVQYIPQRRSLRRMLEAEAMRQEIRELKEERAILFTGVFMMGACLALTVFALCLVVY